MPAPVNVKLQNPTNPPPKWKKEAAAWIKRNTAIGGNPEFYPLTIKAVYVLGIIHTLCESVSHLLSHPTTKVTTYIPACGVFASGIEILGRCVNGNSGTRHANKDLETGFKWLARPSIATVSTVPDSHVVVTIGNVAHTIKELAALRHFAAHGQATSRETSPGVYEFGTIDYELLAHMLPLLANGLEQYWQQLQSSDDLCNSLAKANVIAYRDWPIHLSWTLFDAEADGTYRSVGEIFSRFDWHLR